MGGDAFFAYWGDIEDGGDGSIECPEEDACDAKLWVDGPDGGGVVVWDENQQPLGFFALQGVPIHVDTAVLACDSGGKKWTVKFIAVADATIYDFARPSFECKDCGE